MYPKHINIKFTIFDLCKAANQSLSMNNAKAKNFKAFAMNLTQNELCLYNSLAYEEYDEGERNMGKDTIHIWPMLTLIDKTFTFR